MRLIGKMRWIAAAGIGLILVMSAPAINAAGAEAIRIAIVDFQKVLVRSEAGKRSRKMLMVSKKQKENELKSAGEQLKKESDSLKNNILLTDTAKAKKRKALLDRERKLRMDFKAAERKLQREQMKASESIFTQVQTVINLIAKEQKFDFVVEKSTARTILFSSSEMVDITAKVIERYNDISQ